MLELFELLPYAAAAFVLSFLLTPAARRFSFSVGAIDVPRDGRRMHSYPTARMGGLAIALSFILSYLLFANGAIGARALTVLLGAVATALLGMADDLHPLSPLQKLAGQIVIAFATALSGLSIRFLEFPSGIVSLGLFRIPATVLWLTALSNAFNLIDGIDGLAGGVAALSSAALAVLNVCLGAREPAVICLCLFGATLGFLPHNFNPAAVFMGDTGSLMLGYVLGCASVWGLTKTPALISLGVPLLIFALPFFDTSFAVFRRAVRGRPVFSADRGHLHHRLVLLFGFSVKGACAVLYSVSAMFSVGGLLLYKNRAAGLFVTALAAVYLFLLILSSTRFARQKALSLSE